VIDDEPREWTGEEIEIMRELATAVMTEVELRAEIRKREQVEEALREEYRQVRRVTVFCQSTLRTIKDSLSRHAPEKELLHYVSEAEKELTRISDIELRS
jgi:GAF domain-containing protein